MFGFLRFEFEGERGDLLGVASKALVRVFPLSNFVEVALAGYDTDGKPTVTALEVRATNITSDECKEAFKIASDALGGDFLTGILYLPALVFRPGVAQGRPSSPAPPVVATPALPPPKQKSVTVSDLVWGRP